MERPSDHEKRLISLGLFATAVAHEINTPLFYVEGNLDFLQGGLRDGSLLEPESREELFKMVDDSVHGAGLMRQIVNDLKVFSRPQALKNTSIQLASAFGLAERMASHSLKETDVELRMQTEDLPSVIGTEGLLGILLVNLIQNACNAGASIVTVTAAREADVVSVAVCDDGSGIQEDVLPQIFDPFFTTHGDDGGSGVGLALCKSIAEMLDGEIRVETSLGKGTTMLVLLQPGS